MLGSRQDKPHKTFKLERLDAQQASDLPYHLQKISTSSGQDEVKWADRLETKHQLNVLCVVVEVRCQGRQGNSTGIRFTRQRQAVTALRNLLPFAKLERRFWKLRLSFRDVGVKSARPLARASGG